MNNIHLIIAMAAALLLGRRSRTLLALHKRVHAFLLGSSLSVVNQRSSSSHIFPSVDTQPYASPVYNYFSRYESTIAEAQLDLQHHVADDDDDDDQIDQVINFISVEIKCLFYLYININYKFQNIIN